MSHDVDQSDTAPGAAAARMRERVRIPLPCETRHKNPLSSLATKLKLPRQTD